MRSWRLMLLIGLLLFVGIVTRAFAEGPVDRLTPQITRAEAVAVIVSANPALRSRVLWYQSHMPPLRLFVDINQTDWFAPYLEVAFERGYIDGNRGRMFRPHDLLKTEEAAVLVTRMKRGGAEPVVLFLPTGEKQPWYSVPLQAALSDGIPLPSPLRIGSPVARGSFYAMLQAVGIADPRTVAFVDPPLPPAPALQPGTRPNQIAAAGPRVLRPVSPTTVSPSRAPAPQPRTTSVTRPVTTATTPRPKSFSISMPTLGINSLNVLHPSDPFTSAGLLAPLKYGVGHLFSYPGTNGKILIYGHSSSYPWDVSSFTKIFRQINKLAVGDKVYVDYDGKKITYEVSFKETVPAKDLSAYKNGGSEELILYTCWPPDSISQRYLVHARPVQAVAAR